MLFMELSCNIYICLLFTFSKCLCFLNIKFSLMSKNKSYPRCDRRWTWCRGLGSIPQDLHRSDWSTEPENAASERQRAHAGGAENPAVTRKTQSTPSMSVCLVLMFSQFAGMCESLIPSTWFNRCERYSWRQPRGEGHLCFGSWICECCSCSQKAICSVT